MRSPRMPSTQIRIWALALVLACLTLSGLPFPGPAAAVARGNQGLQYGAVIDNTGNILLTDEALDKVAASGVGWLRINFRLANGYFLDWADTSEHGPHLRPMRTTSA
jgi:hypothetical protein